LSMDDRSVHTIRDTCVHQSQMMAGLWGVKDGFLSFIKPRLDELISKTKQIAIKGVDQDFLNNFIYLYSLGLIDTIGNTFKDPNDARSSFVSFDDIAFGEKRFGNNNRRPHDKEWMLPMPIQRKYGNEYKECGSCGLRHDSDFMGRDECLTEDECKYINLTAEQIYERNNIIKYYKLYQKNKDLLGLTTIYE